MLWSNLRSLDWDCIGIGIEIGIASGSGLRWGIALGLGLHWDWDCIGIGIATSDEADWDCIGIAKRASVSTRLVLRSFDCCTTCYQQTRNEEDNDGFSKTFKCRQAIASRDLSSEHRTDIDR